MYLAKKNKNLLKNSGSDGVISSESDQNPSKNMKSKTGNGIAKPLLSQYTETES